MTPLDKLNSEIQLHLDRQESTGWYSIHCPVCNEKRTRTGGFLFTDEGITYNCFRGKCDATCSLVVGDYVSKKFKNLMKTMGINIPVEILMSKKKNNLQQLLADESHLYKKHAYKQIELPDGCVPFEKSKYPHKHLIADAYAARASSLEDVFVFDSGPYKGASAIGMYSFDKLIGMHIWVNGKYISHYGGNSHILYVPERHLEKTVIVVEGGMDARCFPNTVATLSKKISPEQAYALRGRDVIMLPDRSGGNRYIDQFSAYGWKFCIPDWDVKDLNDAVLKYGRFVVARKIIENSTKDLLEAKTRFKLWAIDDKEKQ